VQDDDFERVYELKPPIQKAADTAIMFRSNVMMETT